MKAEILAEHEERDARRLPSRRERRLIPLLVSEFLDWSTYRNGYASNARARVKPLPRLRVGLTCQIVNIPTDPASPPMSKRPSPGDHARFDIPSPKSMTASTFLALPGCHRPIFPSPDADAKIGPRC